MNNIQIIQKKDINYLNNLIYSLITLVILSQVYLTRWPSLNHFLKLMSKNVYHLKVNKIKQENKNNRNIKGMVKILNKMVSKRINRDNIDKRISRKILIKTVCHRKNMDRQICNRIFIRRIISMS